MYAIERDRIDLIEMATHNMQTFPSVHIPQLSTMLSALGLIDVMFKVANLRAKSCHTTPIQLYYHKRPDTSRSAGGPAEPVTSDHAGHPIL